MTKWFVIDEEQLKMQMPYDEEKVDMKRFDQLRQKDELESDEVQWLHENNLLEIMVLAKGGKLKFTAEIDWTDWKCIYGSAVTQ